MLNIKFFLVCMFFLLVGCGEIERNLNFSNSDFNGIWYACDLRNSNGQSCFPVQFEIQQDENRLYISQREYTCFGKDLYATDLYFDVDRNFILIGGQSAGILSGASLRVSYLFNNQFSLLI